MAIVIKTRSNTIVATVSKVLSCTLVEKLSTVKTFSFETILDGDLLNISDSVQYVVTYNSEYYDVVKIEKRFDNGLYKISFDCEHVSYRLSSTEISARTIIGTPREIVTALLSGTVFTVGSITPTGSKTYTITTATSVRAALLDFCNSNSYELDFNQYYVSVYTHRGSTVTKELVEKNVVSVGKTVDKDDNSKSYSCTLHTPTSVSLGDEVSFKFTKLGINENVRVIGMTSHPFTTDTIEIDVDHYTPTIEEEFIKLETETVMQDETYYGVVISKDNGLKIARSDGNAQIIINADQFKMQAKNAQGVMEDKIYFDPNSGEYKFVGNVDIDGGTISIGDHFSVDENGNAYLSGDATIYGGKYYAGTPSSSQGFTQMTSQGFEVYNASSTIKLRFGYTQSGNDYPYIQLGSGTGASLEYGLVKKFNDGLWIGNSTPADESGNFEAKQGYNGLFFKFTDNTAYVVQNTIMNNIYTGAAIAKFG